MWDRDGDGSSSGSDGWREWLQNASNGARARRPSPPSGVVNRLRSAAHRVRRAIIGSPERYPVRIMIFATVVSALVAFIGLFLMIAGDLDPTASSGPLLRTVVGFLTNFFFYATLALIGAALAVNRWWDRAAKLTAQETRYSKEAVKRLSAEVKSTDGSVRLIGNADHSKDQLRAKLMRAFAGQHPSERPGEDVDVTPSEATVTGKALGDTTPTASLPADDADVDVDADADSGEHTFDVSDLHRGREHGEIVGAVAGLRGYHADAAPPADLTLVRDAFERADDVSLTGDGEVVAASDDESTTTLPAVVENADDASSTEPETDPDPDADDGDSSTTERAAASFRQALQTFRMDLASSLNFDELLWRFAVPALATVWIIFTVAQTPWFAPWVYAVVAAVACLVGTISYGTFKWRRRRKLSSLRRDQTAQQWDTCAVLAKRVETPEQTMFVAWMAGNVYADFDKQRLVEAVADRWHQRLHRETVAPAIQEKFAREIKHMRPLLSQFEFSNPYEGRKAIEDDIIAVIEEAKDPDGLVAKRHLCEQVVDRGEGVGHDPDLVAEVYEEMIPFVLNETEIELTDTDGVSQTVTAVHLRWMDLPDDLAQIRGQFANQFSADDAATYDLPDVDAERSTSAGWPPVAEASL